MKVLIKSYNTCCQNKAGGVQNRVRTIYELLKAQIDVEYFETFSSDLMSCDVLHVFGLNFENYSLIRLAKKNNIKVVISTIIPLNNGLKIDLYRKYVNKLPILSVYKMMIKSAQMADRLIAETTSEADFLNKHYGVPKEKIIVIPNGITSCPDSVDDSIYSYVKKDVPFVLQVGRFDKNKNQLNVIRALKDQEFQVVFIGVADKNTGNDYYERCRQEAKNAKNIVFLGWLDSASMLLKSAYKHAQVFILPSYQETFGLVLLEAGIRGANLAVSKTLPILNYEIFKNCLIFDPSSCSDIKKVVEKAVHKTRDMDMAKKIAKFFSWDSVIKEHLKCYEALKNEL